ncbi:MAG: hypothetical protein COT17_04700 [Elusimicrobia bacterium CG08_land_8_20_14_0_20_51_18]|nr:MAG: hypothetical protein COT17_04700 [Elusimicrobia bacterium CG08_land_8_20_14_0_20_51_18]
MNITEISKITKWMESTDLEEVTLRNGSNKLSLRHSNAPQNQNFKIQSNLVPAASPFIGIFRQSEKGKELKIAEGDYVRKDQTLGYVEVLKELKTIKSPCDGTVKIISVEDSRTVEYSQPLFFIEPK